MKKKGRKIYHSIGADLVCEIKNVSAPLDDTCDMHNHTCHEILIINNGKLNLFTEHSGIELSHGDVALIPKYVFHRGELLTPGLYDRIVINVNESVIDAASDAQYDLNSCFKPYNDKNIHTIHLEEDELEELTKHCIRLGENLFSKTPESGILTDAYFKLIMVILNRKYRQSEIALSPDKLPDIVKRTFHYIDEHLTEDISLKTLLPGAFSSASNAKKALRVIPGAPLLQTQRSII